MIKLADLLNEAKEEWVGLDTIKRGGYGSPTLRNGDKVRMVVDARKNKYYNGVINGNSIKWEDGAKSELSLSMQASNRGDLQVLRPTSKSESIKETKSDLETYHKSYTEAIQTAKEYALKRGYMVDDDDSFRKIGMGPRKPSEGKSVRVSVELTKGGKPSNKQLHIQVYGMKSGYELNCYIG